MSYNRELTLIDKGRWHIRLVINISYPKATIENIILYDSLHKERVPCDIISLEQGQKMVEYLEILEGKG